MMKLTIMQAAERANISKHTIKTLLKKGVLTDLKPRKEGALKHFALVDSKQLMDVVKEHGLNGVRRVRVDAPAAALKQIPSGPSILQRLEEQVARMETKVDQLLAMWR
jgi:hypothetical protein